MAQGGAHTVKILRIVDGAVDLFGFFKVVAGFAVAPLFVSNFCQLDKAMRLLGFRAALLLEFKGGGVAAFGFFPLLTLSRELPEAI